MEFYKQNLINEIEQGKKDILSGEKNYLHEGFEYPQDYEITEEDINILKEYGSEALAEELINSWKEFY